MQFIQKTILFIAYNLFKINNKTLENRHRTRIKSTKTGDYVCLSLLLLGIPSTFLFVLFEVIPSIHHVNSIFFCFVCIAGIFIFFNIEGNFFACIFVDTTINCKLIYTYVRSFPLLLLNYIAASKLMPPTDYLKLRDWHFCEDCDILVPPRSWHCESCCICILKRDHHCIFVGNCIGLRNQRYFIVMLVYLAVGSAAVIIYMSFYLWILNSDIYLNTDTFSKMLCPIIMILMQSSWINICILIYDLNIITCLVTIVLVVFHMKLILHDIVSYEHNKRSKCYSFAYKQNLRAVFGERMNLVWISPFIKSNLLPDIQKGY